MLKEVNITGFKNSAGTVQDITVSYQVFGRLLGTAPVVLVNHALTGNSQVTGDNGWWNSIVGPEKAIDTEKFTVLSFNIPGNGFDEKKEHLIHNYREFSLRDIARSFLLALEKLQIRELFAIVGGSIGGALAWEIACLQPDLVKHLVPIATDYKATDWILAQCKVQDQILNNSVNPVHDARLHAMTFYRTPQSFQKKFNRSKDEVNLEFQVHNWLSYHGTKLKKRFQHASYKLLNNLLTTIDISNGTGDYLEQAQKIKGKIHIITVSSDWFFLAEENWTAYVELSAVKEDVSIDEIKSSHGHDAFLIESKQLSNFLRPIFSAEEIENRSAEYQDTKKERRIS